MRVRHWNERRAALSRIVVVASIAGLSAGCSSVGRFTETPLFAGSGAGTAGGAIESADLGAPVAQPASYAPVTTSNALRERGWTVEGAPIVEVSAADTAASLSAGFGVPVAVILEANGLTSAAEVRPGQRLIIPTYVRIDNPTPLAPSAVASAAAEPKAPSGPLGPGESRHIVQDGDTLDRLAGAYRVPATEIARLNGIAPGSALAAGTSLRIPAAQGAPIAVAVAPAGVLTLPAPEAQVLTPPAPAAPAEQQVAALPQGPARTMTDAAPEVADVEDDGGTGFRWPVRGRIITGFGKQADGARNDGINLAVPAGTPVRAAQEGTVIYAGNELEGYGNLVLIQHKDDWVSAYAHNSDLRVSRGDTVQRGQTIASVGRTGSVETPQLHFELRRKSKPVDPLPQLSGA